MVAVAIRCVGGEHDTRPLEVEVVFIRPIPAARAPAARVRGQPRWRPVKPRPAHPRPACAGDQGGGL